MRGFIRSTQSSRRPDPQPSGQTSQQLLLAIPSQSMSNLLTRGHRPKYPSLQQTYPNYNEMSVRSQQLLQERYRIEERLRNTRLSIDSDTNTEVDQLIRDLNEYRNRVNARLSICRAEDQNLLNISRDELDLSNVNNLTTRMTQTFGRMRQLDESDRYDSRRKEQEAGLMRGQSRLDSIRSDFILGQMEHKHIPQSIAQRRARHIEESHPREVVELLPPKLRPLTFHNDWYGERNPENEACAPLGREKRRQSETSLRHCFESRICHK